MNMRRSAQALAQEQTLAILERAPYGILGLVDKTGQPYTVPLHFVMKNGRLYFHCAKEGYKMDCIRYNSRVSVSVVEKSAVVPEIASTDYRSATAQGYARLVEDAEEKRQILELLLQKFCAGFLEEGKREIGGALEKTCIVEITLQEASGKQASQKTRETAEKRRTPRLETEE